MKRFIDEYLAAANISFNDDSSIPGNIPYNSLCNSTCRQDSRSYKFYWYNKMYRSNPLNEPTHSKMKAAKMFILLPLSHSFPFHIYFIFLHIQTYRKSK